MSEFSIEDDPDPLPELRDGLHYYDVHDFINEIVPADSLHTCQYREWYPQTPIVTEEINDVGAQLYAAIETPLRSRGIFRRLGKYARIALVE